MRDLLGGRRLGGSLVGLVLDRKVSGQRPVGSILETRFRQLLRRAGLPDPILYPGSYSDWTRAGLPVNTGPGPGDVPDPLRVAPGH